MIYVNTCMISYTFDIIYDITDDITCPEYDFTCDFIL